MNGVLVDKQQWAAGLRAYISARRHELPIPERSRFSAEQEAECQIIGSEFQSWNRDELQYIIGQRQMLRMIPFDQEPIIVCTTSMPGLVALQEIVPEPLDLLYALLVSEFNEWNKIAAEDHARKTPHHRADAVQEEQNSSRPETGVETMLEKPFSLFDDAESESADIYDDDDNYDQWSMFTAHHWSYFERLTAEDQPRARSEFPDIALDELRQHVVGDVWGPLCGSESGHLWHWNGVEMKLLKPNFSYSIS
jgi:hypothetical protein